MFKADIIRGGRLKGMRRAVETVETFMNQQHQLPNVIIEEEVHTVVGGRLQAI